MDSKALFDSFILLSVVLMVIHVLLGFYRYRKLGESQRTLVLMVSIALLAEAFSRFLNTRELPTYPVFHVYAVIEYGLIGLIYARFFKGTILSIALRYSIPALFILAFVNVLFWQPFSVPNTNVVTVVGIVFMFISISFFFRSLSKMLYRRIERSAMFWISIGVLVYFSSILLMFAYLNWLVPLGFDQTNNILFLNLFFNIIHYLCFNIALWMDPE